MFLSCSFKEERMREWKLKVESNLSCDYENLFEDRIKKSNARIYVSEIQSA
jgi:hypothetical protein